MPSSGPVAGRIPRSWPPVPAYLWRCDVRLSPSAPLVFVLVVSETPTDPGGQQQGSVESTYAFCHSLAVVVGGSDAGVARASVRAVDDASAALPGQRWEVAALRRTSKPADIMSHPDWCAPDRCGHLVPPLMTHMARRHRGPMYRVGETRSSGTIITYLIGADALSPLVAVHATCRAGNAWAELSLPQAAQLVEQLRGLLEQAGGHQGADDE